jgi:hypothetical protein
LPKGPWELLTAATLDDWATVAALAPLYEDPADTEPVVVGVMAKTKATQVEQLIPVLRVAAGTVEPAEPFVRWVDHPDSTVRLVASTACAERGQIAGMTVLVDLLDEEELDRSGRSPAPIWTRATLALARLTGRLLGPPLDADRFTRLRAQAAWRDLLKDQRLKWSAERREWD